MDNKNIKNIKIGNNNILKIMSNNSVLWQKLLKPDYEFYDSEIGNNSNWARGESNYWYLSKFEGQYVVYVRHAAINNKNKIYMLWAGGALNGTISDSISGYFDVLYDNDFGVLMSNNLLFQSAYEDNTYKTYVFICPKEYNTMFDSQLQYFIQSLNNSN